MFTFNLWLQTLILGKRFPTDSSVNIHVCVGDGTHFFFSDLTLLDYTIFYNARFHKDITLAL
jgi:hypothetical protein